MVQSYILCKSSLNVKIRAGLNGPLQISRLTYYRVWGYRIHDTPLLDDRKSSLRTEVAALRLSLMKSELEWLVTSRLSKLKDAPWGCFQLGVLWPTLSGFLKKARRYICTGWLRSDKVSFNLDWVNTLRQLVMFKGDHSDRFIETQSVRFRIFR